jgi:hypothetical protein
MKSLELTALSCEMAGFVLEHAEATVFIEKMMRFT